MISVKQANNIISESIQTGNILDMSSIDTLGQILAEDVYSPINMPPFKQSAMDGYALGDVHSEFYTLIGEIKAGDSSESFSLKKGEAIRIFTGGMVPNGCKAIAKQEIVTPIENKITLQETVKENANIRPLGEQIKKGELAIQKGTKITAGTIGYLYGIGVDTIRVFKKPTAIVIATGNELTKAGEELAPGKIYESNTYTIKSAFQELGIDAVIQTVKDDYISTKEMIEKAIQNYELVVMTGGISVGDYDFVGKAFNEIGVEQLFYKVKQKPGKPIFFGKQNNTSVFGLPGNPAAALSCFYIYVVPALKKMMGYSSTTLEIRTFKLANDYSKTSQLSHFLKANYMDQTIEILNTQSSAMLSSFSEANCILYLEEGKETWEKGENVQAFILP